MQAGAVRPGVMLERPSLLARPWTSANTVTDRQAKESFGDMPKAFGMARGRGHNPANEEDLRERLFSKCDFMMDDARGSYGGSFVTHQPELQSLAFCPPALVLYDVPFHASTGELIITRSM